MIVGIEVGGTFTDLILVGKDGRRTIHKVPSTPSDPSEAAAAGLAGILEKAGGDAAVVEELLHGSTIAANALIQRKGAKTALITTRGFRDVLFIQRADKTHVYDMFYQKPEPLIRRGMAFEVSERVAASGEVLTALDEAEVASLLDHLANRLGVESVAVCLLHAYANPAHERAIADLAARLHPDLYVSLSSDVSPEHREYERTSTTVISAFVRPTVDRYLSRFDDRVKTAGFPGTPLIMQSNGGVVPIAKARQLAANMFLSGPAAAVTGAADIARACGTPDVISIDVGGTSCDVCLITGGEPHTTVKGTAEFSVDGLPLNVLMTDIATIGAGGGSIARIDAGGMLRVGPESAGADPGPACYGRSGEQFTLTDAMLLMGVLDAATPLPGNIALQPDRSRKAAEPIASALGLDAEQLAERVYRIAVSNMAQALRRVSVRRGHDPRGYGLFPCGGAGPLIAAALAEEVGMRHIVVPPDPGIFSAFGLAVSDVRIDYVLAQGAIRVEDLEAGDIAGRFDHLRRQAAEELGGLGYPENELVLSWTVDARYVGQGYELRVAVDPDELEREGPMHLAELFHRQHARQYGHSFPTHRVELISVRLTAAHPRATLPPQSLAAGEPEPVATRDIVLPGGRATYRVFRRETLPAGFTAPGPIVVTEESTSTPVPPGWTARVDGLGVLHLERKA